MSNLRREGGVLRQIHENLVLLEQLSLTIVITNSRQGEIGRGRVEILFQLMFWSPKNQDPRFGSEIWRMLKLRRGVWR